ENTSGQWEEVDGVGGTLDLIGTDDLQIAGLLIVRQTEKLHEEIPEILDRLRKPLEIPVKEIEPTRTRSVYVLADAPTATDLQKMLPRLIVAPGVSWPADSILRVGSSLIVTQTEAVHHRIERLITAMEKIHKTVAQTDAEPTSESKNMDPASGEKE
ncbi:MAG: hypothetical protein Q8K78_12795, partial [Planctomycetaceae bacterium]|nr:hypothetical protein [Planctomycetaceae bacterium]